MLDPVLTILLAAYFFAVSSAIIGSVGLRKLLLKCQLPGFMGKVLLESTPYFGLVFASTVNLFFSRSKDLTEGICVNDPATGSKIEGVKSKECGLLAFRDGLIIRWLLPIPGKSERFIAHLSIRLPKNRCKSRSKIPTCLPTQGSKTGSGLL